MKHEKIIMYYDSHCPICRTEAYHLRDKHSDKILIVSVDEGMSELAKAGISRVNAMTYLCVQDNEGNMHTAMNAIRLLYSTAELKYAKLLYLPVVKQLTNLIYPIFARNRYYMPDWLTKLIFGKVKKEECNDAICNIPPEKRLP